MSEPDKNELWEDVTAFSGPRRPSPASGTHRIAGERGAGERGAGGGHAQGVELDAPEFLARDAVCSIIAEFVSRAGHRLAGVAVRDVLDRLGLSGAGIPQPLAGQLVLGLANHLQGDRRAPFLAHAWNILAKSPKTSPLDDESPVSQRLGA